MVKPAAALRRLQEGNARFVANLRRSEALSSPVRRAEVADNHQPFAVILGCSDARVPAEIVFDQGLGDLFVIRVAGNVVAPSGVGSVEFAVERFGVETVVVLGHSRCGAVDATLEALSRPGQAQSRGLRVHRRPGAPGDRGAASHRPRPGPHPAGGRGGEGQHPRLGQPAAARVRAARAAAARRGDSRCWGPSTRWTRARSSSWTERGGTGRRRRLRARPGDASPGRGWHAT